MQITVDRQGPQVSASIISVVFSGETVLEQFLYGGPSGVVQISGTGTDEGIVLNPGRVLLPDFLTGKPFSRRLVEYIKGSIENVCKLDGPASACFN